MPSETPSEFAARVFNNPDALELLIDELEKDDPGIRERITKIRKLFEAMEDPDEQ